MISASEWLVAYLFRWFPHPTQPGLRKVGSPDKNSPVLVTCNFSLTVNRLMKALDDLHLWLLVVPSDGINVWCGACGGGFNHNRVIDTIKTAGLVDKVSHREIILPSLSAPGMDRRQIKDRTGFIARFGPVHADDIREFLSAGKRKTKAMCRFKFNLRHRLDMLVSMNFITYLPVAIILAIFRPRHLLPFTLLFWSAVVLLYLLINWIPGRTGWTKAMFCAVLFAAGLAAVDWLRLGDPVAHWGWFIASFAIFFGAGFDLAGIATGRRSDPTKLLARLGIKSIGSFYRETEEGIVSHNREKCRGCRTCLEVCPTGVFGDLDKSRKMTLVNRGACFACDACCTQCPHGALSLVKE